MFDNILIFIGTISFGEVFTKKIKYQSKFLKKISVFRRNKIKQLLLKEKVPECKFLISSFVIGNKKDKHLLKKAFKGINIFLPVAAINQSLQHKILQWDLSKSKEVYN